MFHHFAFAPGDDIHAVGSGRLGNLIILRRVKPGLVAHVLLILVDEEVETVQ